MLHMVSFSANETNKPQIRIILFAWVGQQVGTTKTVIKGSISLLRILQNIMRIILLLKAQNLDFTLFCYSEVARKVHSNRNHVILSVNKLN